MSSNIELKPIQKVRFEVVTRLLGAGLYNQHGAERLVDDADEIVKFIEYGFDKSDNVKQLASRGVSKENEKQ